MAKSTRRCEIDGCDRKRHTASHCITHHRHILAGLPLDIRRRNPGSLCSIDGCERAHKAGGFCTGHAERKRRGLHVDGELRLREPGRLCGVDGCENPYSCNDMCIRHYKIAANVAKSNSRTERTIGIVNLWISRRSMFGNLCWICGDEVDGDVHRDHVKPSSRGGMDVPANWRPAHAFCNVSKHSTWPFDTSTKHLRLDPARLP